jgi:CspA family cold shock protein
MGKKGRDRGQRRRGFDDDHYDGGQDYARPPQSFSRAESEAPSGPAIDGVVKWYNPDKGFGFVNCSDGGKDVFVHASVLERARLTKLDEGQRVEMQVVTTPKGREATSVGLLD